MLSIEEIRKHKTEGEYIAVCISGKRYHASFVNKYAPDGVMFFCIPDREIPKSDGNRGSNYNNFTIYRFVCESAVTRRFCVVIENFQ